MFQWDNNQTSDIGYQISDAGFRTANEIRVLLLERKTRVIEEMGKALFVMGLLCFSMIAITGFYYFDPLGGKTSYSSRASSSALDSQVPITPVKSGFSEYLTRQSQTIATPTPTTSPLFIVLTPTPTLRMSDRPTVSAVLSTDKRTLAVTFGNLRQTKMIQYIVTYTSASLPKGVTGSLSITPPSAPIRRLITLGSCSLNVCTFDTVTSTIQVNAIFVMDKTNEQVEVTKTVAYQ